MSIKEYNKLTYKEKLALIRFYPEEAKKDGDHYIRQNAYRTLGFTKDAKKDKNSDIRLQAYRALGYTGEALNDKDYHIRGEVKIYIREEAKIYLDFIKSNKKI